MGLYQAEGIVLANRDLGEADRVVILFCREQGKIEAVARGARRPRNRLVGLTLPFNLLRLAIFSGRGLDELSQVESIRSFSGLRGDLLLLSYASYFIELTREFLPEREPNPAVYSLLLQTMAELETGADPEVLARLFELRLLDRCGLGPSLQTCLACGKPPAGEFVIFHPAEGGICCATCAHPLQDGIELSRTACETLRRLADTGFPDRTPLSRDVRREIQGALQAFIEFQLGRELRSLRFLAGLEAPE